MDVSGTEKTNNFHFRSVRLSYGQLRRKITFLSSSQSSAIFSQGQFNRGSLINISKPQLQFTEPPLFFFSNRSQTTRTTNSNEDGDFVDHWSLPCVTFQKCFHLHNFGIFFLIANVTQPANLPDGSTNIKAWVQCAYPNRIARNFRFSLELLMGNMVATFTDYVVGAQSDSEYIQSNNNCLNVVTVEQYARVTIEMKISKTMGAQNLPRNDRTDCRSLPVSNFFLVCFV